MRIARNEQDRQSLSLGDGQASMDEDDTKAMGFFKRRLVLGGGDRDEAESWMQGIEYLLTLSRPGTDGREKGGPAKKKFRKN